MAHQGPCGFERLLKLEGARLALLRIRLQTALADWEEGGGAVTPPRDYVEAAHESMEAPVRGGASMR